MPVTTRLLVPVTLTCDAHLRLPLVNTTSEYVPVNTLPVNTWGFFLSEYSSRGEGVSREAKKCPETTANRGLCSKGKKPDSSEVAIEWYCG